MFRFPKTVDVITLFHAPHLPASIRVHNLLKRISAKASDFETPTEYAPSTISASASEIPRPREPFELNVSVDDPTPSQVETMLDYAAAAGPRSAPYHIIQGAKTREEALKLFKQDPGKFVRPTVVDWNNGWIVSGDKQEALMKMFRAGSGALKAEGAKSQGSGEKESP
jgi:hypothetical protein